SDDNSSVANEKEPEGFGLVIQGCRERTPRPAKPGDKALIAWNAVGVFLFSTNSENSYSEHRSYVHAIR
ncbi:MAG: hypothetical protein ABW148_01055, partial [Sedimenticola sp.]